MMSSPAAYITSVDPAAGAISIRRLRAMLLSLAVFLGVVMALNWIADPYGLWGSPVIDSVYRKSEPGEAATTMYLLRHVRPTTVLIGTSRVLWGMPIEQGYRDDVLNAGLPAASMEEIATIVEHARQNPRLRRLVWGVDFPIFSEQWVGLRDPAMAGRIDGDLRLEVTETLLSLDALEASRKCLFRFIGGVQRLPPARSAPLPWPQALIEESLERSPPGALTRINADVLQAELARWANLYTDYRLSAPRVERFRDLVTQAIAAGTTVQLVVVPLSEYELELIRQSGHWETLQDWKRQLLATGPYWDFSGYNDVAYDPAMFADVVHFSPAVGHLIFRHVSGESCEQCGPTAQRVIATGVWVDATTVERHLAQQDANRQLRMAQSSLAAQWVTAQLQHLAAPVAMGER